MVSLHRVRVVMTLAAAAVTAGIAAPASGQLISRAAFIESFPIPSADSGAPQQPVSLGTSSDGTIHIVDRAGAVFTFTRDGTPGSSYGEEILDRPIAIAFDDLDQAYVLDERSRRVQVFRGDALRFSIGAASDGPARLDNPIDLAVGPGGFVYVLDEPGPRLQIFGRDGVFIRTLDLRQVVRRPVAVAVDGDGTILLASEEYSGWIHAIPPFPDLPWSGVFPSDTIGVGARGESAAIVSDRQGTAILLDAKEGRIWGGQRLRPDSVLLSRPIYGGRGTGRGSFQNPTDVAFTPERDLLILDRELRKVERIRLSETERVESLAFGFPLRVGQIPPDLDEGAVIGVAGPVGSRMRVVLAGDRGRRITFAEGDAPQWTDAYGSLFQALAPEEGLDAGVFEATLGKAPGGVAFNDTLLVIVEPDEDRFSVYDLGDGTTLGSFGQNYEDDRRLRDPEDVALFSDGSIVVADYGNDRLAVFSPDLASLIGAFPFLDAGGVAVTPDDRLVAWDASGGTVSLVPTDGSPHHPIEPALVPRPVEDIDFDRAGNLFALEKETGRVTVLSAALDRIFIRFGGRDPEFEPDFISVDDVGNLYLSSIEKGRTEVSRWDLALPELQDVRVTLTRDGARARWSPIESSFLSGYQLLGAETSAGPYVPIATTDANAIEVEFDATESIRWIRVAPVTIAGTMAGASNRARLVHLDMRAADAADDPGLVLGSMRYLDSLTASGSLAIADELAPELEWRALAAEVALGLLEDAVARESALEGWMGDDDGFLLHTTLGEAHAELENHEAALEHARAALDVIPADLRAGPEGVRLLQIAVGAAAATGDAPTVIEMGEELRGRVDADDEYLLESRIARAHLALGRPDVALTIAGDLLERDVRGDLRTDSGTRGDLAWTALRAAIQLDDRDAVERWRREAEASVSGERLGRYHRLIASWELRQGRAEEARNNLTSLTALQDEEAIRDSATVGLSFDVYHALQDADTARVAGFDFLREYIEAIPSESRALHQRYQDSLALFTTREETRKKLGPGFEAWKAASFVQMVEFFESVLTDTGALALAEEVVSRSLLAGGYLVLGREERAREQLTMVLALAPDHDPSRANAEAEAAFGVTPFDDTLSRLLDEVRSGR
ncbi:MAG: hypothetical protein RQ745_10135 [Longimicrobiales bacterium]|nr:hypothetical protein [Longimicrobiales bacterium]